jgi:hypothetical protein
VVLCRSRMKPRRNVTGTPRKQSTHLWRSIASQSCFFRSALLILSSSHSLRVASRFSWRSHNLNPNCEPLRGKGHDQIDSLPHSPPSKVSTWTPSSSIQHVIQFNFIQTREGSSSLQVQEKQTISMKRLQKQTVETQMKKHGGHTVALRCSLPCHDRPVVGPRPTHDKLFSHKAERPHPVAVAAQLPEEAMRSEVPDKHHAVVCPSPNRIARAEHHINTTAIDGPLSAHRCRGERPRVPDLEQPGTVRAAPHLQSVSV